MLLVHPVTVPAARNSKRSSSTPSSMPRLNAQKQELLVNAFEDLPRRWERIVHQENWT